jgi:DUF4097 and DUF4098 domain-containing protein YvlB
MINALLLAMVAAATTQVPADTTFAVPREGRVEVVSPTGDVTIRSWDRNEMRVRTSDGRRGNVNISTRGNVVYVEATRMNRGRNGADIEITLPAVYAVSVQGMSADADISGVSGGVAFSATQGSLRARNTAGGLRAESVSGDIDAGDVRGGLQAKATNGNISLARVQGDVFAETVNGDIDMTEIGAAHVAASSVNGRIRYAGRITDNGRYHFSSHNGNIVVSAPERTSATFYVSTYNGRIDAGFPIQMQPAGADRRVSFALGAGSARVEVETFNGNLRVVRP